MISNRVRSCLLPPPHIHSGDSSTYARTPWKWPLDNETTNARAKKAYGSVLTITAASSAGSEQYADFAAKVKRLSADR